MTERIERRGGARIAGPGKKVGRPPLHRKPITIYVTEQEREKILKAVPRLRQTAAGQNE